MMKLRYLTHRLSSPLYALAITMGALVLPEPGGKALGQGPQFDLPEGFEVIRYADDDLAHDIFKLTIDAKGRVVVAGRNYIKVLHDDNGDGRADRAEQISTFPGLGARGMYFDGDDLIVSAADGIYRLPAAEGEGSLDVDNRQLLMRHSGGGEHTANSVLRGPDGWYYVITGDDAGIGEEHASLSGSPVREPRQGALVRIAPEGSGSHVLAHGFRNPYDFAFNAHGHVFTWDADGERVEHLPWFIATRLFDVAEGTSHGWINSSLSAFNYWNPPAHFFDQTAPIADLGRGSPTGVAAYRHRAFPQRYRDGLFLADWSHGRILFHQISFEGSSYRSEGEVFLQATGGAGFAVTALEVGPDGDLFASVGGRGTRGAVYRIRYTGDEAAPPVPEGVLGRVLEADQPLSSWSRADWLPVSEELGRKAFEEAISDERLPVSQRIRAVEVLVEVFGGISAEEGRSFLGVVPPPVGARVLWAVARAEAAGADASRLLAEKTSHAGPRIARAAWEGLAGVAENLKGADFAPDYLFGFENPDRRIRHTAMRVARDHAPENFEAHVGVDDLNTSMRKIGYFYVHAFGWTKDAPGRERLLRGITEEFAGSTGGEVRLDLVRLLQIGLGDIASPPAGYGYVAAELERVSEALRRELAQEIVNAFPTGDEPLDQELARLAAMLKEAPQGFLDCLGQKWNAGSSVPVDIHYLTASSYVPGKRSSGFRKSAATALVRLQLKLAAGGYEPTRHWPGHVQGMLRRLIDFDPDLAVAIASHDDFGLAAHSLLVEAMAGEDREVAAFALLAAAEERSRAGEPALTPELLDLLGEIEDPRILPLLRRYVDNPELQHVIVPLLARQPIERDRHRFLSALQVVQGRVVETAARALATLPGDKVEAVELGGIMQALHRWADRPEGEEVRGALVEVLRRWSGRDVEVDPDAGEPEAWFAWFRHEYPEQAQLSLPAEAEGLEGFEERLADVDFGAGDPVSGGRIFGARGCMACHTGSARLGPELDNIAERFAPEDLLRMINQPELILGPDSRTTTIVTAEGNAHTGQLIYDSEAVRILRTRDGETVHVARANTREVRHAREPLMPSGLLQDLDAQALADLHAYLAGLNRP
ncbi:MAG: hypothetical protein WD490_00595 [Opitutales bacterium]